MSSSLNAQRAVKARNVNGYTLYVNKSESRCGNCNKSCSPYELQHDQVYGPGEGCGIVWKYIDSDYMGLRINAWAAKMRPDLIYVGPDTGPDWYEI